MHNSQRTQKIAFLFLFLATLLIVVPVGLIVVIIIQKGLPAINWQFLTDIPRQGMRAGGIFPAIVGTMYLVAGAIVFALPIGLLAAIYLSEYSKDNFLNPISIKYLFNDLVYFDNKSVKITSVDNFEGVNNRDINICFSTIQKLHSDLTTERENSLTFEDFRKHKVVLIADEAHHINV
ncbi:MAG: DEAD/DEAH box helicase family protein, partial [Candidatus Omnitrophica bacterium]|nr:DEAD/DEAH box helicase family protein [Candidatus Omnitrophota bacterium]